MITAESWDYFIEGRRLTEEVSGLRGLSHVVKHPSMEPLIPNRTWAYHDGGQEVSWLNIDLVDYYRCWPCADPHDEAVAQIIAGGVITSPLVLYSDGQKAILGEGNHRLAAAKVLGLLMLPVSVIPDRLMLGPEHAPDHLKPVDPDLATLVSRVTRRHHGAGHLHHELRHQLSIHTEGDTVYVFCACGAHWRRPSH